MPILYTVICVIKKIPEKNPGGGEIFRMRPDLHWGRPSFLYNVYRVFPGTHCHCLFYGLHFGQDGDNTHIVRVSSRKTLSTPVSYVSST
jgi:hypothetical protein